MIYYILPFIILFVGTLLAFKLRISFKSKRLLFVISVIPASLISVFRGDVGTDTFTYLNYFRELKITDSFKFEPGFEFLSRWIKLVCNDERLSVAVVSLIIIILIVKGFSYSKEQIILFSLLFFPLFFYDMSMNGLRYGLGFSLVALSIDNLYKLNYKTATALGFCAITIQYSCVLILICFFLFKIRKIYLISLIIIFSFLLFFLSFNLNYFYDKQDFYKDAVAPGGTSGLGPLFVFLSLVVVYVITFKTYKLNKTLVLIVIFELLSYLVTRISYAGLRLQMLYLFTLILFIRQELPSLSKRNLFFFSLFFLGFFSLFLSVKNMNSVIEDDQTPFIPYKFFWQE